MTEPWQSNPLKLDGTRVIDRRIYVDQDIYAAEQASLFARTWQWVAHESELRKAGDYIAATVAGREIVVARDRKQRLNAFYNACTHRGACVTSKRRGNTGATFVCMYHGWSFDHGGRLANVPWREAYGEHFNPRDYDIPKIRVETCAGHVFVVLDADAPPLLDFLGEAGSLLARFATETEVIGRVRWKLNGNWKLWHDNFRDNYHPQFTHRQVGIQYRGVEVTGRNLALAPAHSLLEFPPQGDRKQVEMLFNRAGDYHIDITRTNNYRRPPHAVDLKAKFEILAIFPNFDYQYFLNGSIGNFVQIVRPTGVDSAIIEGIAFGRVGEPAEVRRWRLTHELDLQTSAGKISGDDIEAARRCMLGFTALDATRWSTMNRGQAPGTSGFKHDEYSLRQFYVAYKQYMGAVLAG